MIFSKKDRRQELLNVGIVLFFSVLLGMTFSRHSTRGAGAATGGGSFFLISYHRYDNCRHDSEKNCAYYQSLRVFNKPGHALTSLPFLVL